jgi:5-oxopent-3-ene-1,2,5-tricarboxylate decarboxylase/2-hydroxyhepta-2,4-diene-1,7-dioate isomerase
MRHARVAYDGAVHRAIEDRGALRLADGRRIGFDAVAWLPPIEPRTIFAVGLNYADHAKELAFKAPEAPLVFIKGCNTVIGHRGHTRRPADATYMHYECELAVAIGRHGRDIPESRAYDYIAGYTVANDYAIRDYLENYYRPNLRVKSRDGCTPLGPWLVDASDIADPMNLRLTTRVNGELTQDGSTRDMIFSVPFLVGYLSQIMTLAPGDLILTGTPEGLRDVRPGDVVAAEIESVGLLVNTVVDDATFFNGVMAS